MGKPENDKELARLDAIMRADLEAYSNQLVKIKNSPDAANDRTLESGKLVPFVWNEEQRFVHERLEKQLAETGKIRALILKPRQRGISTYIQTRFYHKTTWITGQNTFILTHKDDATKTLLGIVQRIHENMPTEFAVHASRDAVDALAFKSIDSKYSLATAGSKETGRSDNIQNYHGSEVAFWDNAESHAAASLRAVPKGRGTEIILESTANGIGNWFYSQWLMAERGISDYQAIFFPWYWGKGLRMPVPEGFKPSDDEHEYMELHDLDMEQVVWMHYTNIELLDPGADPEKICWKFRQEFPATSQEAFQVTGADSLIKPERYFAARKNNFEDAEYEPIVLGMDTARGGNDKTRVISRAGRLLGKHVNLTWDEDDETVLADKMMVVIKEIQRLYPGRLKKIFIDITSAGKGCHDILKRKDGLQDMIVGVMFSGKATEEKKYRNKRAEIWARLAKWFAQPGGVDAPDDDVLHRHICGPGFKYDTKDRLQMEKKEDILKRLHFSPDGGDGSALTLTEEMIEGQDDLMPNWAKDMAGHKSQGGWMVQ